MTIQVTPRLTVKIQAYRHKRAKPLPKAGKASKEKSSGKNRHART